jgi:hypothetical protein
VVGQVVPNVLLVKSNILFDIVAHGSTPHKHGL